MPCRPAAHLPPVDPRDADAKRRRRSPIARSPPFRLHVPLAPSARGQIAAHRASHAMRRADPLGASFCTALFSDAASLGTAPEDHPTFRLSEGRVYARAQSVTTVMVSPCFFRLYR